MNFNSKLLKLFNKFFFEKNVIYIIAISLTLSLALSFYYIKKYDNLKISYNNELEHPMLKIAVGNSWVEADQITKDVKKGKNFFISGGEYDEFLPQRIISLYYLLTNNEIFDDKNNFKVNNGKFGLIFLKTLIYYLSLFYLSKLLFKKFSKKNSLLIILFLCLEPTIFQYHSSFWNESIGFIFQIFLFFYSWI